MKQVSLLESMAIALADSQQARVAMAKQLDLMTEEIANLRREMEALKIGKANGNRQD